MAEVKTYTLTLNAQELHDLIEADAGLRVPGGADHKRAQAQRAGSGRAEARDSKRPSGAARQADAGGKGG